EIGQLKGRLAVAAVGGAEHLEQVWESVNRQCLSGRDHVPRGRENTEERHDLARHVDAARIDGWAAGIDEVVDLQRRLIVIERQAAAAENARHVGGAERHLVGAEAGARRDRVGRPDSQRTLQIWKRKIVPAIAAEIRAKEREQRRVLQYRKELPVGKGRLTPGVVAREGPERGHWNATRIECSIAGLTLPGRKYPRQQDELVQSKGRLVVVDGRRAEVALEIGLRGGRERSGGGGRGVRSGRGVERPAAALIGGADEMGRCLHVGPARELREISDELLTGRAAGDIAGEQL